MTKPDTEREGLREAQQKVKEKDEQDLLRADLARLEKMLNALTAKP